MWLYATNTTGLYSDALTAHKILTNVRSDLKKKLKKRNFWLRRARSKASLEQCELLIQLWTGRGNSVAAQLVY